MLLFALKFIVPRLSKIILSYLTFTLKLWDQNGDKWCVRNTIYHSCKYWPKIKLIPRQFFSDDETIKDVKVSTELYIMFKATEDIPNLYHHRGEQQIKKKIHHRMKYESFTNRELEFNRQWTISYFDMTRLGTRCMFVC